MVCPECIIENFTMDITRRHLELHASHVRSKAATLATAQSQAPTAKSKPLLNCSSRRRVMFLYWGRRGAMSRFTLSLAEVAKSMDELEAIISVSRDNELFDQFVRSGTELFPISAFSTSMEAITRLDRIVALRKSLAEYLRTRSIEAVVTLMPHVWSPLVAGITKRQGIPYTVVVHDATGHIGDSTSLVNRWLLRDARRADRIVTLSRFVTDELIAKSMASERLVTLFLPNYGNPNPRRLEPTLPLRILFFGRILPYKGLLLFVTALELVRARGISIEIGVYGEGKFGRERPRLEALGAKIVNHWIPENELDKIFASYDVLVLSHIEASQSGAAALALGSGLPVVSTPSGGLTEQVIHEFNGLIADSVTPAALAAQICRLATDPALYQRLSENLSRDGPRRSMRVFVQQLMDCCLPPHC